MYEVRNVLPRSWGETHNATRQNPSAWYLAPRKLTRNAVGDADFTDRFTAAMRTPVLERQAYRT